jgi:hypothetical protein
VSISWLADYGAPGVALISTLLWLRFVHIKSSRTAGKIAAHEKECGERYTAQATAAGDVKTALKGVETVLASVTKSLDAGTATMEKQGEKIGLLSEAVAGLKGKIE